jgi:hypothetical protein
MREALEKILAWSSHPDDLGLNQGSNGIREFYRDIAYRALKITTQASQPMASAPLTREILIYDDDLDWQIAWMDEGYWASAEGQLLNPRCWMEKPAKP